MPRVEIFLLFDCPGCTTTDPHCFYRQSQKSSVFLCFHTCCFIVKSTDRTAPIINMTAFLNYCLFATLVLARSTDAFKCGTSVTTECLGATDIRYDATASNNAADQAEGECLVSCRLLGSLKTCSHLLTPCPPHLPRP